MTTPEQISYQVESLINKHQVFEDNFINNWEKVELDITLDNIKKEIGTLAQNAEELEIFNKELRKQIEAKWLSQDQVKRIFEKEINDLNNKIDIRSVTIDEINKELNIHKKNIYDGNWLEEDIKTQKLDPVLEDSSVKNDSIERNLHNQTDEVFFAWLPNEIEDLTKQINFVKRKWKTKEIREQAKLIKEDFLYDIKFINNTLKKYDTKLTNWRFNIDRIKQEDKEILKEKIRFRNHKINNFISWTITGDNPLTERWSKKD